MPVITTNSRPSILDTPGGPIPYWTLFDEGYTEGNARDANMTRMMIAVKWEDSLDFKKYALGFSAVTPGSTFYDRTPPMRVPWAPEQFLVELKKNRIAAGNEVNTGVMIPHAPSPLDNNWWGVRGGTIIYEAVFANPDYDIIDQSTFRSYPYSGDETFRYFTPEETINARERKHSSAGFELDLRDVAGFGIPNTPVVLEVGFVPFHTIEKVYTQVEVPWDWRPRSAIANCLLRVNDAAVFGNPPGTLLFKGPATKLKWHRQPDETRAVDIPFLLDYNPRGWNTVPRNDQTNQPVRVRNSSANPIPLYQSASFATMFRPQPIVAIEYSVAPGRYKRPIVSGTIASIPIQFNAIVTAPAGTAGVPTAPYTFAWTFGDGGTDTTQFPLHAYNTIGSFTATVTVTGANGNVQSATVGPYVIN
jgi:hypothetical protein